MAATNIDLALHEARGRVMQTAQGTSGAPQPPQFHQVHFGAQDGVGAPFPQPGGPSASSAPGASSSGGQNVLGVLALTIGGLHDSTSEKFAKMDGVVRELAASLTDVREAMHTDLLKLAEWQDKAHERQMKASMLVLERVRALERTMGDLRSLHGEETVTRRLQRIDCALTELLEQVQDPQAGRASLRGPLLHVTDGVYAYMQWCRRPVTSQRGVLALLLLCLSSWMLAWMHLSQGTLTPVLSPLSRLRSGSKPVSIPPSE